MNHNSALMNLVSDLSEFPEIDAVLLGGSRARGVADASSDYDLYVYCDTEISDERRRPVIHRHLAPGYELGNRFWETEDDGYLAADGVAIDIVYRSLSWLSGHLDDLLDRHQAGTGYTTCMWRNLGESKILFDRENRAAALQQRADVPYPDALAEAITARNRPLLAGTMPCYRDQVAKAAGRGDRVSVNHRTAAWLESYFDILFAINRIAHPGEKKIVDFLEKDASRLPEGWKQDLDDLLTLTGGDGRDIPALMDRMVERLDTILA